MKKRTLAEVLWNAANVVLPCVADGSLNEWSCNAALRAEFGYLPNNYMTDVVQRTESVTDAFLRSLGCDSGGHVGKFLNFREGKQRQGMRYLWLMLAMHVAEDEGLMC